LTSDDRDEHSEGTNDLVRFFRALGATARRDYEVLAEQDRAFGENVAAERAAKARA
jgi:hypothetical protein